MLRKANFVVDKRVNRVLNTFIQAWNTKELRRKIIFTALIFLVYRLFAHIPVPVWIWWL